MSDNEKILKTDLKSLVERFSQKDVVEQIEQQFASMAATEISPWDLDDQPLLKPFPVSESELTKAKQDLQSIGFVSRIVVRKVESRYQIVLGRRPWIAALALRYEKVPVIIAEVGEEEALLMLLASLRETTPAQPLFIAVICQALSEKFRYKQLALASLTHYSRPQISNLVRLLDLPKPLLFDIHAGKLSYGHAKVLVGQSEDKLKHWVDMVYQENLSVHQLEHRLTAENQGLSINPELAAMALALTLDIKATKTSVKFSFKSKEDRDQFLRRIGFKS